MCNAKTAKERLMAVEVWSLWRMLRVSLTEKKSNLKALTIYYYYWKEQDYSAAHANEDNSSAAIQFLASHENAWFWEFSGDWKSRREESDDTSTTEVSSHSRAQQFSQHSSVATEDRMFRHHMVAKASTMTLHPIRSVTNRHIIDAISISIINKDVYIG